MTESFAESGTAEKILLVCLPFLLLAQLFVWSVYFPMAMAGHVDFRQFYAGGYMLRTGRGADLYDYGAQKRVEDEIVSPAETALPVNHLAYEEILFIPFTYLGYRAAYFAFMVANLALLIVCILVMKTGPIVRAVLAVGFIPLTVCLLQGQDSILLLALLSVAAMLFDRDRELSSGLIAGLGFFRFQIVIPLSLLFLLWRRWRFVGGFVASSATVLGISVGLVGSKAAVTYARSLQEMSTRLHSLQDQIKYGLFPASMPNLRGVVYALSGHRIASIWNPSLTLVLSLLVILAAGFSRRPGQGKCFAVAITASLLVSYHSYVHDLSILLLPIAWVLTCEGQGRLTGFAVLAFIAPVAIFAPGFMWLAALPVAALFTALVARPDEPAAAEMI